MSAAWAAVVVAGLAVGGGFLGWAWRAARREGKFDALLEQLVRVTGDHEERLRAVERAGVQVNVGVPPQPPQSIGEFLHGPQHD